MKKMILLSVFALGALSINAQTEAVLRGGDFWDNWYVGGRMGGTMNMNGTGFFKSARPAFGMAVGKQWTPIFATEIQGLVYVNTTNSPTMFDASDISLLGTMNLMNLIGGYEGIPRMFEIETLTGIGWLHHYMNGEGDTNDLSARIGLNLNFNLGESKAWTFSLRPAMAFNLTGQIEGHCRTEAEGPCLAFSQIEVQIQAYTGRQIVRIAFPIHIMMQPTDTGQCFDFEHTGNSFISANQVHQVHGSQQADIRSIEHRRAVGGIYIYKSLNFSRKYRSPLFSYSHTESRTGTFEKACAIHVHCTTHSASHIPIIPEVPSSENSFGLRIYRQCAQGKH